MYQLNQIQIGWIGGGKMAEAIFKGFLDSGLITPAQIHVADVSQTRIDEIAAQHGVHVCLNNPATNDAAISLCERCDVVFLAVKPQFARQVLETAGRLIPKKTLIISIVGGAPLSLLDTFINAPIARAMPNTPMMVREGVVGLTYNEHCTSAHQQLTTALFSLVGQSYSLPESLIDPLTAVSGCGPAYAYMFIEALADGGVEAGLSRDVAVSLAAQTLLGAAKMVLENGSPAALKGDVCSPGGSTIAGVHALESNGFRGAIMDAVKSGMCRMSEVGNDI